ncbi:hypothetical protein GcC1_179001 [Golovinomyces cichoracearum]|uniref:SWI5-dependent HO expression protein 3 n=1 Tax=Golovinomyces cichoracearum TaxID=62708 RepID=A0A420HNI7_9PEZI|nr:hypothetical protein GcC1_179001 [Golovinomyces cichoracearum]
MISIKMNALKEIKDTSIQRSSMKAYTNGTIRSVPSQLPHLDSVTTENLNHHDDSEESTSHYTSSNSTSQFISNSKLPIYISNATILNGVNKVSQKQVPSDYVLTVPYASGGSVAPPPKEERYSMSSVLPWNSAIGRAGIGGKSGRVIERLMGDNDMLKRDLNIERLKAEEHRHAYKMVEGKMEALTAEYEGKLHDAAINKTLLKRKERQLSDLQMQVETERARANAASDSERIWKEEIERVEKKAKQDVEDALNYAAMMESRNNAMTSHWKDQGTEVNRTVTKLSKEIENIVLERKQDDERLNTLQGLCDQQASQLTEIVRERDAIAKKFEEYKSSQEEALRNIKAAACEQGDKSQHLLNETLAALQDLKWALGVVKSRQSP